MIGTAKQLVGVLIDSKKEQLWELKPYKEKRSLNANSYFHVLTDKLRHYHRVSMAVMKNDLISSYGQFEYMDGQIVYIKTQIPPEKMAEQEHLHCQYVKTIDGLHFYRVCRGTHTYNTAEMARLIDGTVSECKEAGIETLPPYEIERMKREWGKPKGKKAQGEKEN
jgi:hypothetical protein